MLSKRVLDALREEFHEEFGELSERDDYIQRMKADAFALIGSMAPNDRRLEVEVDDAITGIVSASSLLGFYIGLKPGPIWSGIFLIPSSQSAFWKCLGSWMYRLSLAPVISRDNGGCDMRT